MEAKIKRSEIEAPLYSLSHQEKEIQYKLALLDHQESLVAYETNWYMGFSGGPTLSLEEWVALENKLRRAAFTRHRLAKLLYGCCH